MDETLKRLQEARAAREQADRTVEFAGEKLVIRAHVPPQVGLKLETTRTRLREEVANLASANGQARDLSAIDEEVFVLHDETAIACLEPESQETWMRMRSPDGPAPLIASEVIALTDYLVARAADLPTDGPSGSSDGPPDTSSSSKAGSSSRAKTRTG